MKALEKGAFDFITKPDAVSADAARESIVRELAPRVRAVARRLEIRNILKGGSAPSAEKKVEARQSSGSQGALLDGISGRMARIASPSRPEMVLIGVSTGGPQALARIIPALPGDIGVPLLIVQHMPPIFTQSLAESLALKSAIKVREAADGEVARPNTAYIAPGGRQMRLVAGASGEKQVQITDDPPENNCRPAVDYLFRSVAANFPGRAFAAILTGMGSDGTIGLRLLRRHGCYTIAQDETSCVVFGMPRAAIEAGAVDAVLPLDMIASRIAAGVRGAAA